MLQALRQNKKLCHGISVWESASNRTLSTSGELLTAPKLTNNPSLDVIATNKRPLLSIFNASGGTGKRTYIFQVDTVLDFDPQSLTEYKDIPETNEYITEKQIEKEDVLAPSGKTKFLYGEQFHAEIKVDYNEATPYLVNFLKMALRK